MTPEEQRQHIAIVQELSRQGGALDKAGQRATINNPAWFRTNGSARAVRRAVHERLSAEVVGQFSDARDQSRALVLAGPPGAGKGRVADAVLGANREHYVNIDADEFKKLLLREAIADGSYESWIKPAEVSELESQGETFYPLELASLVHEESSRLATQLREDLIAKGTNVVVDTVLGNEASALALAQQFEEAGYQVTIVDVEVPYEVSEARIVQRWQEAMQEAESGKSGALGGRWVPSTYARPLFETEHGRSKSQDVAEKFAEACPVVARYERHFTSWQEHESAKQENRAAAPELEAVKVRATPHGPLEVEASAGRLAQASFPSSRTPGIGTGPTPRRLTPRIERGPKNGIER